MSDSLWPHGLQHTSLLCPPLSPRVCSNSCPLSQWCYLTISCSAAPFSFCLHSFPASGSFPMSSNCLQAAVLHLVSGYCWLFQIFYFSLIICLYSLQNRVLEEAVLWQGLCVRLVFSMESFQDTELSLQIFFTFPPLTPF